MKNTTLFLKSNEIKTLEAQADLLKGAVASPGTVHTYKDGSKHRKESDGSWSEVSEGREKGKRRTLDEQKHDLNKQMASQGKKPEGKPFKKPQGRSPKDRAQMAAMVKKSVSLKIKKLASQPVTTSSFPTDSERALIGEAASLRSGTGDPMLDRVAEASRKVMSGEGNQKANMATIRILSASLAHSDKAKAVSAMARAAASYVKDGKGQTGDAKLDRFAEKSHKAMGAKNLTKSALFDLEYQFLNACDDLLKAKAAQLGEVRTRKNGKYQKTANGWVRVKKGANGTAKVQVEKVKGSASRAKDAMKRLISGETTKKKKASKKKTTKGKIRISEVPAGKTKKKAGAKPKKRSAKELRGSATKKMAMDEVQSYDQKELDQILADIGDPPPKKKAKTKAKKKPAGKNTKAKKAMKNVLKKPGKRPKKVYTPGTGKMTF